MPAHTVLFDFTFDADLQNWMIENDSVMGGESTSDFSINDDEHLHFSGEVSLENDGGFAQILYRPELMDVRPYNHLLLRVKGDGNTYQARIQADMEAPVTYAKEFTTSGQWETIRIPFKDMAPTHHGEALDLPNYDGNELAELGLLIGNGREEEFELLVDWIGLR